MLSVVNSWTIIAVVISTTLAVHANEAPPPPSGHGGGGAEKKEEAPAREKTWSEIESRLSLYKSKRDGSAEAFKKAREERNKFEEGTPQFNEKMKEYLSAYKQWVAAGEDYNKTLSLLKYRYPERVLKKKPEEAKALEHKTIEELDAELGIDGKLNKNKRTMNRQFGKIEEPKKPSQIHVENIEEVGTKDSLESEPTITIKK